MVTLGGYESYRDEDAQIIYDIDEERALLREAHESGKELILDKERRKTKRNKYQSISETRGEHGVFDLEEIVLVVEGERIRDVAVIKVPPEKHYADYLVIGTGRNSRHLFVTSQVIQKLYKRKCHDSDASIHLEGNEQKGASGWIVMDAGNIVVHLFTQEQRDYYDLESLWTVGSKFDQHTQEQTDLLADLMTSQLQEFQPAEEIRRQEQTKIQH